MNKFSRIRVNKMWLPGATSTRTAVLVALAVIIATFGLYDVRTASAYGEPEPEPAKPANAEPPPPPLTPRPTEYPRGLNEKLKPGTAPEAKSPAAAMDPKSPPEPAKIQSMPAPVAGEKPGDAPKADESSIPRAGNTAAKVVHWTPPKRYHFVMDAYTGLAMGGNDPVAFFVDGQPRLGLRDHELDWGGTTWHFLNDGNLSAFKLNPEVYAPRFGGRCVFALSQGLMVEGQPEFFVIHRDRLYLFANAGNRAAFLTNPDALSAEADRMWPMLTRGEP